MPPRAAASSLMRRILLSLPRALPLPLLLLLLVFPWFGAVAKAQLRDWQVRGRMQYRALHDSRSGGEDVLRRARLWTNGFVAPHVSMRFQYDFVSERVLDSWVAYEPSAALEVRLGRVGCRLPATSRRRPSFSIRSTFRRDRV